MGKGSYGSVFKVKYFFDNQLYALKVFSDVDEEQLKFLKNEAQIHAELNHKNIIKYQSCFLIENEKLFIILMEFAEDSLDQIMKTMSQQQAFTYFYEICDALNYIHEKKKIHRDIKKSNILLKNGEIKLCDMGEAKQFNMTHLNNTQGFGSPNYLAPEVLKGQAYNEKVDVWAAGVVFHQMLSNGVHPFNPSGKNGEVQKNVLSNSLTIHDSIKNTLHIKLLLGEF